MEGIFVPLSFFLALFAILYVYWTNRARVRMALIEKGATGTIFNSDPALTRSLLLKWGIFLIGFSLGVISGYALSAIMNEVAAFFTMILFFGGAALIVSYFLAGKSEK